LLADIKTLITRDRVAGRACFPERFLAGAAGISMIPRNASTSPRAHFASLSVRPGPVPPNFPTVFPNGFRPRQLVNSLTDKLDRRVLQEDCAVVYDLSLPSGSEMKRESRRSFSARSASDKKKLFPLNSLPVRRSLRPPRLGACQQTRDLTRTRLFIRPDDG